MRKDPKIDEMLVGEDTWPFRGPYSTILRNDDGKFDETDQARSMERVLDTRNLEFEGKPLWTCPKPHWIQCNYS